MIFLRVILKELSRVILGAVAEIGLWTDDRSGSRPHPDSPLEHDRGRTQASQTRLQEAVKRSFYSSPSRKSALKQDIMA